MGEGREGAPDVPCECSGWLLLLDEHPSVMLLVDAEDGRVLAGNREAQRFYGWSTEQGMDAGLFEIDVRSSAAVAEDLRAARGGPRPWRDVQHLVDGEIRSVAVTSWPVAAEGRVLLSMAVEAVGSGRVPVSGSVRDEVQRRREQSALVASVSRSALVSPALPGLLPAVLGAAVEGLDADVVVAFGRVPSGFRLEAAATRAGRVDALEPATVEVADGSADADGHGSLVELTSVLAAGLPTSVWAGTAGSVAAARPDVGGGLLVAYADRPGAFDEGDELFIEQLALVAAQARRRADAERSLHEELKAWRSVARIAHEIDAVTGVQQVCDRATAGLWENFRRLPGCGVQVHVDGKVGRAGAHLGSGVTGVTVEVTVEGRRRGELQVQVPAAVGEGVDVSVLLGAVADILGGWLVRREAAATLRRGEQRMRLLLDQLPAVVWTTDTELTITTSTGVDVPGATLASDELVGLAAADFIPVDQEDGLRAMFATALAGGSAEGYFDGFERRWRNRCQALRDADGRIIGTINLGVDVTEEEARSAELAATQARLQAVWSHARDAMLLADDAGRYLDVNPAAEELTGYAGDQLRGATGALLADVDPVLVDRMWASFRDAGTAAGDFTVVRRDGAQVETEFHAVADILPGVHLSIMRDVTDRRRGEREVADREERFRAIAEHAGDGIYRIQMLPDLALTYLNPAVESLTGFSRAELYDRPGLFLERCHPDDLGVLDPSLLVEGQVHRSVFRFQHADGNWRWFEDQRTPIVEDDRTVGIQGVYRDVTRSREFEDALQQALAREQRSVEELRAITALKSSIIQAVSHELRTPMSAILGYAATLHERHDQLEPEQVALFEQRLHIRAVELSELLEDLLDLERLADTSQRGDRTDVDVGALVRSVVAGIDDGSHPITTDITTGLVAVDPVSVERIVTNLVQNARKHTPPGTPVRIRAWIDDGAFELAVEDDGPGIPATLREAIFEPFWQGPHMGTSPSPGAGIGLSLVRQLALAHGGHAWVEPAPQAGGSRFRVRLVP